MRKACGGLGDTELAWKRAVSHSIQYREKILLVFAPHLFCELFREVSTLSLRHPTTVALPSVIFSQGSEQCHYHFMQC